MYFYILFSTLNIGYFIFKYSIFGTTKYMYNLYYNKKNNRYK